MADKFGWFEQAQRHWMAGGAVLFGSAVVIFGSALLALPAVLVLELAGVGGQENLAVLISAAVFGPYYMGKALPRLIRDIDRYQNGG